MLSMEVVRRGDLMSTSTNVIYAHKKFGRGSVDSWEGKCTTTLTEHNPKNINVIQSTYLVTSSACHTTPSQSYNAFPSNIKVNGYTDDKNGKQITCQNCKELFQSELQRTHHRCVSLISNTTASAKNDTVKDDDSVIISQASQELKKVEASQELKKVEGGKYIRSFSLPYVETAKVTDVSSGELPIQKVYKPKFRAQYSLQENIPTSSSSISTSSVTESSSLITKITHGLESSAISSCKDPLQSLLLRTSSSPSSSSPDVYSHRRQNVSSPLYNTKAEDSNPLLKITSQTHPIWKGIKSPSPELLEQHITKLIVQNQAIVETQNPLWSIKHKRQLSHNEDGGHKRRYSISELPKISRASSLSAVKPRRDVLLETHPELLSTPHVPSLPKSTLSSNFILSSSPSASKINISSSSLMPVNASFLAVDDSQKCRKICIENVTDVGHNRINSLIQKEKLVDHSHRSNKVELFPNVKSSKYGSDYLFVCSKCNICFSNAGMLDLHIKYNCSPLVLRTEKSSTNDQEIALNLHKKNDVKIHFENPHPQTSRFILAKDVQRKNDLTSSPNHYRIESTDAKSPPNKKRKQHTDPVKCLPFSSVHNKNGKFTITPDYSLKMIDDLKPKINSHHIYGGEVQICDGKAYKTLKIDSNKSEAPSLDLCIASQELGGQSVEKEAIPTSVVVTIAQSGLNSGGTVVKLDNQFSYKSITLEATSAAPMIEESTLNPKYTVSSNIHMSPHAQGASSENSVQEIKKALSGVPLKLINSSFSNSIVSVTSNSHIYKQNTSLLIKENEKYPAVLNFGENRIPYVPGIPGPYSQASTTVRNPPIYSVDCHGTFSSSDITKNFSQDQKDSFVHIISNNKCIASNNQNKRSYDHSSSDIIMKMPSKLCTTKPVSEPSISGICTIQKLPDIRVQPPPPVEIFDTKSEKINNLPSENKQPDDFLMPIKRPSTLMIKPQAFSAKPCLSLIGSTLVSPDTPRPKKSCAQLFLNGSAYTYLNLKVSTKTFFCCIYRPQPMYVIQSSNSKLSMYSNWQVRKTDDPLNLTPSESMSLHVSGLYYNRAYTIAKPKSVQLSVTPSSYWILQESKLSNVNEEFRETNAKQQDIDQGNSMIEQTIAVSINKERDNQNGNSEFTKRIKIFEGGFKTNEDYTYVRGRGRGRYVCASCGIRCKKPSMLKKHIRTHTDLRPFACNHCSFSFKTKGNLTKHLKSKAHFKRCTDIGVIPVPTSVNDSHINHEALQMQIKLDRNADKQNTDDEEEDDDDEEEDEECDDDEEEDDDNCEKLDESDNYINANLPLSLTKKPISQYDTNDVENTKDTNDSLPMDLSIKRTSSVCFDGAESSVRVGGVLDRPTFLPLSGKSIQIDGGASTFTPIKEHPSEILSPVTESSMLLRSIYDTTFKVSSSAKTEKRSLTPDPVKETGSSGFMLQTYLKERAVLDCTRKRQYMNCSSPFSDNSSKKRNTSLDNSDFGSSSPCQITNKVEAVCSTLDENESVVVPVSVIQTNNSIVLTSNAVGVKTLSENASNASSSLVMTSTAVNTKTDCFSSTNNRTGSVRVSDSASSSTTMIIFTTPSGSPVTVSSSNSYELGKVTPSSLDPSKSNNISTLSVPLQVTAGSRMPTPPANLTVMNSCGINSKTAFIAPSGIIPTNHNRMELDDGKCKCSICSKEFDKPGQLSLHMYVHYIERPHRCDSCGISFRTSGHLQKHKRSVSHLNKVNMHMTFGTPSSRNPRPFKCRDCEVAFRIHGHLAKHLRSKSHIMKLECLGKLPFGTYAEIEKMPSNFNDIDTSDCENSLESLQTMAEKLLDNDPSKLAAWRTQKENSHSEVRQRTVSNSSTNSEEYPLVDDHDTGSSLGQATVRSSGEDSDYDDGHGQYSSSESYQTSFSEFEKSNSEFQVSSFSENFTSSSKCEKSPTNPSKGNHAQDTIGENLEKNL